MEFAAAKRLKKAPEKSGAFIQCFFKAVLPILYIDAISDDPAEI
jgi:hypothetical protein